MCTVNQLLTNSIKPDFATSELNYEEANVINKIEVLLKFLVKCIRKQKLKYYIHNYELFRCLCKLMIFE